MNDKDFPTTDLGHCLVTGSAGYLGRHLVAELIRRGHPVRGFDRGESAYSHERFEAVRGDICDRAEVRKACEGIDTVFHTAAVLDFTGFATRARRERSHSVNVGGVENILHAAREAGVARLVSTSTNNVTLDGPVVNGDESWPYAKHPSDLYTETKILGEKAVLAANEPDGLLTCAIRPGGIYGPGEALLFPRLIEQLAAGTLVATLGDGTAKSDNTFIDNLVDGHVEAARHLIPGSPLGGQAYFITDGVPINYFEFFRPFVEGLGFRFPTMRIPIWPLAAVAAVWEFLHYAIKIPAPIVNRLEVRKISVTHYSRIDKAQRDFGWTPPVSFDDAIERCLPYCRELLARHETVDRPHPLLWVSILFGMGLLGVLSLSPTAHAWWSASVTTWTPRWMLAGIFGWAVLLHVHKGMKAVRLAEQAGLHRSSMAWGWQTFLLGFASLGLLEKRIESRRSDRDSDRGSAAGAPLSGQ